MDNRRTIALPRASGLLLLSAAWALFLALNGAPEATLFTIPVFLLAAPLAFGRYIGEETLARLRRGLRHRAAARPLLRLRPLPSPFASLVLEGRTPVRGPPHRF